MTEIDFATGFEALTGNAPFPWQRDLYDGWFSRGEFPDACTLPTGLGKTSVIAVWLIALANGKRVPRRLVYVVNRRTVVDQTTDEVEKYRKNLSAAGITEPLAISTLRGQFADNREWSADPSRPAVICGTVDMIGGRLLFSGYGCGFKTRPLHAGFLGQDALLVHDEAHLEPAFQTLLLAIEKDQHERERTIDLPWPKLRVMELTATSRGGSQPFGLTDEEKAIPDELPAPPSEPVHFVWQRMRSRKGLKLHPERREAVAKSIGVLARRRWLTSGKAVLIFVRTIDDVKAVQDELTKQLRDGPEELRGGAPADSVQLLTGTLRGLERDALATRDPIFARFMPKPKVPPKEGTVYLICTSAGEVGVDISADHMVCDLTTLDGMAQRFGRVNRRGEGRAEIDLVYETDPNPKPPSPAFEAARWRTKAALERLTACDWIDDRFDASPAALGVLMRQLTEAERDAAFAPPPTILPATDFLFDAWALTTIKGKLPGRPPVEPYLHGISDWQPPETHVAWREEVWELRPRFTSEEERKQQEPGERKRLAKYAAELLADYPLKPHELLREPSYRAFKHLEALAKRRPDDPAWLIDDEDNVEVLTLKELADKDEKDRINGKIVLLAPASGGLEAGMLNGGSVDADDVADDWFLDADRTRRRRTRLREGDSEPDDFARFRLVREVPLGHPEDEDSEPETWEWYVRPRSADDDGSKTSREPVRWQVHTDDVIRHATRIADAILNDHTDLHRALVVAAQFHDLGKKRAVWQRSIGHRLPTEPTPEDWLAKSGKGMKPLELTSYRHEFGSLVELESQSVLPKLTEDQWDLVQHLIATHHGRGRPHFPTDEAFDPERPQGDADKATREVPQRYARLQRKYGRWGLAYLESLLRAADYAASAKPSEFVKEGE